MNRLSMRQGIHYIDEPIEVDLECAVVHLAHAKPDVHPVSISACRVLE